jgi:hypothetical protein
MNTSGPLKRAAFFAMKGNELKFKSKFLLKINQLRMFD